MLQVKKNPILAIFLSSLFLLLLNIQPCIADTTVDVHELQECEIKTNCVRIDWNVEDVDDSFDRTIGIIKSTERTEIIERNPKYIHAEVTSKIMKYKDDLEVLKDVKGGKLQIRSASRVGTGDFGVNNKRITNLLYELKKNSGQA